MFALTDQARARRQGIVYGTAREVVPNRTAHMSIRDAAEAGRFAVGPASFQPVPETEEAANTAYRPDVFFVGAMLRLLIALLLLGALACGGSPVSSPTAPAPSPSPAPAPTPVPPALRFTVVLPVAAGDTATNFFGMTAFGIHFGGTGPSGHGLDGHPGWDVEYRVGAQVRAAADGIVQSVFTDSFINSRSVIQIQHQGGGNYRTVYTNVESVAAGITANAPVTRGQVLGGAGVISPTTGRGVSYAMTHFQVDDFSRNEGSTNPNSVNPETFLDPAGRTLFDTVWKTAAYDVELTEPFTGNTRDVTFPITRTWTRESGSLAARIDLVRRDASWA